VIAKNADDEITFKQLIKDRSDWSSAWCGLWKNVLGKSCPRGGIGARSPLDFGRFLPLLEFLARLLSSVRTSQLGRRAMNTNTARNIFATSILASVVSACGGGDPPEVCPPGVHPVVCAPRPGEANTPVNTALSLAPSSLTIGNCTTRVPFIFSGGTRPYTIFTSDNFSVPVSSALELPDGRFYFFADIKYPVGRPQTTATVTVLDSQSKTASAALTTPQSFDACSANPLLRVLPESANFRASEILAFQVSGGPAPAATPTVTFADEGIAEVVSVSATVVNVRAIGVGTTLMTIASGDGQRASVVINVLPQ
jgi:hypothetical protein